MAQEIFIARESTVNPINAVRGGVDDGMAQKIKEQSGHLEGSYKSSERLKYLLDLGFNEKQADVLSEAIEEYTTLDEVTQAWEHQNKDIREELVRVMTLMDIFAEKSPKWNGGATYRGVPISSEAAMKTFKVGSEIDTELLNGHSWTTNKRIAERYGEFEALGHKGVATILVCEGVQRSGTSIRHLSRHWGEQEVYVASGAKHVVTRIEQVPTSSGIGKTTIVYVKSVK